MRDQVAVALEHVVVAQEDDRRRERAEAEQEDGRLLDREGLVDPVEHDEPDRRERRAQREQVRVGVRQRDPQEEVGAEADREEVAAVDQAGVRDLVRALGEDRREARP